MKNLDPLDEDIRRRPQNIDAVRSMYDRWATFYPIEFETGFMDYRAPEALAQAVIDAIPDVSRIKNILDAGAGTGISLQHLRPTFQTAHRTALDLSPRMLEHCIEKNHADTVHVANLDGEEWPVADASQDLVISVGVTGLIADMPNFLREASRILKPEGMLATTFLRFTRGKNMSLSSDIIKEYSHHHLPFNKMAEQAGFQKLNEDTDFPGFVMSSQMQQFGLYLGQKM